MTPGKRRYLLALVEGRLCEAYRSVPAQQWGRVVLRECAPCAVKRIDRQQMMGDPW